jgi:hypothetical protein
VDEASVPQPSPFAAFEEDDDEASATPPTLQPMAQRTPSPVFAAAAARIASLKTGVLGLFKPKRGNLNPQPQSSVSSVAIAETAREAVIDAGRTRPKSKKSGTGVSVIADLSEADNASWFARFLPFICAALLCLAEYFLGRYLMRYHAGLVFYRRITFWKGVLHLIAAVVALSCAGFELFYPTPADERDWSLGVITAGSALSLASCASLLISGITLKMKYIVYIHFWGKSGYFCGLDVLFALGAIMMACGFSRRYD